MIRRTALAATVVLLLVGALPAHAQRTRARAPSSDSQVRKLQDQARTLESRVENLERRIAQLTNRLEAVESNASEGSADVVGFTEEGSSVVIERGGSRLEIGPSGLTLEGNSVRLRGSANATLESQGVLTLKGSANAKLETSGALQLKGSTVQINGGSKPIATRGSAITGASPAGGVAGQVVTGSPTVLVP